ncbi:MAG: hypothetical protein MUO24_02010, partial [Desulfobacterales bacterium]|nr:hypothetical protein [Desulfobacterales bacterium]
DIGLLQEPKVRRGIIGFDLFRYLVKSKHLYLYYMLCHMKGQDSPPDHPYPGAAQDVAIA